jgi:hypothetical protein
VAEGLSRDESNAIIIDCLPEMIEKKIPTIPCMLCLHLLKEQSYVTYHSEKDTSQGARCIVSMLSS